MANPILVALDVDSAESANQLISELSPLVGGFKIGSELFTICGPDLVRQIRQMSRLVFLDLKYHDIPNTVARAVAAAVRLDVQILTVHASGGLAMMRAAEQAAQDLAAKCGTTPPLIAGVTVLTSLDNSQLREIGVGLEIQQQVENLARLALLAELRGLVCSPLEVSSLRRWLPPHVQLITPGIRSPLDPPGDQKRTLTPKEAIMAGSNWLVIGRPIYAAPDPRAAAASLLATLE